jgi:hypothetical protein
VEFKVIPVFLLLGVFVVAVVGMTRRWSGIHLGLLYALEESRQGLGA